MFGARKYLKKFRASSNEHKHQIAAANMPKLNRKNKTFFFLFLFLCLFILIFVFHKQSHGTSIRIAVVENHFPSFSSFSSRYGWESKKRKSHVIRKGVRLNWNENYLSGFVHAKRHEGASSEEIQKKEKINCLKSSLADDVFSFHAFDWI